MFKKDELKYPEDMPLLENKGVTEFTNFKITIEEIKVISKPEVIRKWIHKENKSLINGYDYKYKDGIVKENYLPVEVETGDTEVDNESKILYEQKFESMDLSEVVLFLNRAK